MLRRAAAACRGGILLATCTLAVAAPPPGSDWTTVTVPGARQTDVSSSRTGYRYRLFVAVPPGPPPAAGHPVLYVLDGNAAFPVGALLARIVASRREVTGHEAPIVVGIGYPGDADFDVAARRRDYTMGNATVAETREEGGASAFLDFIVNEVKPLVASQHRVDPERQGLFGHSFGGLFVLYALFERPAAFSAYLASSPSIWWNDSSLLALPPKLEAAHLAALPRVQITVGSREDDPPSGARPPEVLAMIANRRMIEPARKLSSRLRELPGGAQRVSFEEIEGEDHGTVWLAALARAVRIMVDPPPAVASPVR